MNKGEILAAIEQAIKWGDFGLGELWAMVSASAPKDIYVEQSRNQIKVVVTHKNFLDFEYGQSGTDETEGFVPLVQPIMKFKTPDNIKTDYTREELIEICKGAIVPAEKWANRDTPECQKRVGELFSKLIQSLNFNVIKEHSCEYYVTDDKTIRIECDGDSFYLPTPKRLVESKGEDWY